MIFPRFTSLALVSALLLTSGPAVAQFQTLGETVDEAGSPEADFSWSVRVVNGETILAGDVPHLAVKELLNRRAGEQAVDRMGVAEGAPRGFLADAAKAIEASALLSAGVITYENGSWTVTGVLADAADSGSVADILGARTGFGADWEVDIEQAQLDLDTAADEGLATRNERARDQDEEQGAEVETAGVEETEQDTQPNPDEAGDFDQTGDEQGALPLAAAVEDDAAEEDAASEAEATELAVSDEPAIAVDACREQIDTFMADRSILFASGSARLAPESEADLADVAEMLADCPAASVYVEGHTDADGGADANLILSLSRAETVVYELTQLGIDPRRLYAVGYGANLPIASNETAAGKAQNRRIVFSFEDAAGDHEEGAGH